METNKPSEADDDCFPNYDPFQHLDAIHSMLRHLSAWLDDFGLQIQDSRAIASACSSEDDMRQAFAECNYIDACSASVFADAAFSNAVVGALAPLFEGVFIHECRALKLMSAVLPRDSKRHRRCGWADCKFWNPYLYAEKNGEESKERNIHQGTMQILEGLGMLSRFPPSFRNMTCALFRFRNRGLHHGLEWLKEERIKFMTSIDENPDWARWFHCATSDREPWVIGITSEFMEECFGLAVQTVHVFEKIRFETRMKMPPQFITPAWATDLHDATGMRKDLEAFMLQLRTYDSIRTAS